MSGDAYEAMKQEDRAGGIAAVARKHTQKQGMEVSALIFQYNSSFAMKRNLP